MQPSVKGDLLRPALQRLNRLLNNGKIARSELEFRLEPEDLDLLDSEASVEASLWYPVACFDRLLEILRDLGGRGEDDALVSFARASAGKLFTTAPYLDLLSSGSGEVDSPGAVLAKLSALAFNFTRWEYEGESLRDFRVHVSQARDFPETARWSTQGLMEAWATKLLGSPVSITHERLSQDHIVYHGCATPGR